MADDVKTRLTEFAAFAQSLDGDEKSEADLSRPLFPRLETQRCDRSRRTFAFRVAKKPGSAQLELTIFSGPAPC